jgi:hypothetical protein
MGYTVSPVISPQVDFDPSYAPDYLEQACGAAVNDGVPLDIGPGVYTLNKTWTIPATGQGGWTIRGPGPGKGLSVIQPSLAFDVTKPLVQRQSTPGTAEQNFLMENLNFDDNTLAFSGTFVNLKNPSGQGNLLCAGTFRNINVNCDSVTGIGVDYSFNYGSSWFFCRSNSGPAAPSPTAVSMKVNLDTGEGHLFGCQVKGQTSSLYLKGNLVNMFGGSVGQYLMLDSGAGQQKRYVLYGVFIQGNVANLPNIDAVGTQAIRVRLIEPNVYTDGSAHPIGNSGGGGGLDTIEGGYWSNTGSSETIEAAGWTRSTVGAAPDLVNLT